MRFLRWCLSCTAVAVRTVDAVARSRSYRLPYSCVLRVLQYIGQYSTPVPTIAHWDLGPNILNILLLLFFGVPTSYMRSGGGGGGKYCIAAMHGECTLTSGITVSTRPRGGIGDEALIEGKRNSPRLCGVSVKPCSHER